MLMRRWFTKEVSLHFGEVMSTTDEYIYVFFYLQITKEEYDIELRTFLSLGQIKFHNKFILSVLSKCSNKVVSSSPLILTELDLQPEVKRIKLEELDTSFKRFPVR